MAHGESRGSGGGGRLPGPASSSAGKSRDLGVQAELTDSTSQLVAMLQLRLALLRKMKNPHLSAVAALLEEQLAVICREIGQPGEDGKKDGAD